MKVLIAGAVVVALFVGLYLFGSTRRWSISTEIDIAAPPSVVWQALTDFKSYHEWNPAISRIDGEPIVGSKLKVTINPNAPTGAAMGSPEVLVSKPNEEFAWWERRGPPGFMYGVHYYRMTATETGTHYVHGGDLTGLVTLLMNIKKLAPTNEQLYKGFNQQNEALKKRAEALARAEKLTHSVG